MVVVTDQRIITTKGLVSKTQRILPISKVQDASLRTSLWVGHVIVTTAGGSAGAISMPLLGPSAAREIVEAIQTAVHAD
jgi:membrane protein YdbS with pleckstrin-like domain